MDFSQEDVQSLFDYRDGMLFHKKRKQGTRANLRAGAQRSDGYRIAKVFRRQYYEHRIIFLYHHGYLPEIIDHINQDNTDNNIENLREATRSLNATNTNKCNAVSGVRGVYWDSNDKTWTARIYRNGKNLYFGRTKDFFEACCLRKSAENRIL